MLNLQKKSLQKESSGDHDVVEYTGEVANADLQKLVKNKQKVPNRLWYMCTITYVLALSFGITAGVIGSTFAQPQFFDRFPNLQDASNATSLQGIIVACFNLGGALGVCGVSAFSDRFGRKKAFLYVIFFTVLGSALLAGAQNVTMLCFGRLFVGVGAWAGMASGITYASELSPATRRGDLAGPIGPISNGGYLICALIQIGFYYTTSTFNWRGIFLIQMALPLVALCIWPFIVESPRWLCYNGRGDEGLQVFKRLHGTPDDQHFLLAKEEHFQVVKQCIMDKKLPQSWVKMFTHYGRRTAIVMWLTFVNQCAGPQVITNYGPTIYKQLGFDSVSSIGISAGFYAQSTIMAFFWLQFCDRWGRKPLLCNGVLLTCISFTLITALFAVYVDGSTGERSDLHAGQSACVAMFFVWNLCYQMGEPIVFLYLGEVFGTHIRTKGIALALVGMTMTSFWITLAFPIGLNTQGWRFLLLFVIIMAVGYVVQLVIVQETRRMPLEEMARIFNAQDEVAVRGEEITAADLAHYGVQVEKIV